MFLAGLGFEPHLGADGPREEGVNDTDSASHHLVVEEQAGHHGLGEPGHGGPAEAELLGQSLQDHSDREVGHGQHDVVLGQSFPGLDVAQLDRRAWVELEVADRDLFWQVAIARGRVDEYDHALHGELAAARVGVAPLPGRLPEPGPVLGVRELAVRQVDHDGHTVTATDLEDPIEEQTELLRGEGGGAHFCVSSPLAELAFGAAACDGLFVDAWKPRVDLRGKPRGLQQFQLP